jgi:predicted PurR-regulated permease PerM
MNHNASPEIPHWSVRQIVLATLLVVAVVIAFWLLFYYRAVVFMLLVAIIIGTALQPLIDWFGRRKLPKAYGLAFTLLFLLITLLAILILITPTLVEQALKLGVEIPQVYEQFRTGMVGSMSPFIQKIGLHIPAKIETFINPTQSGVESFDVVSQFLGVSAAIVKGFFATITVFLLAIFWDLESERVIRGMVLLVPSRHRGSTRENIEAIQEKIGGYVRGQLILCLSIALLALLAYLLIGLPNALALALIAGLFEAIPMVGPALGAAPAFLIAFSIDSTKALWVVAASVVMQALENYLLVPRVMGASVGVNPIVTLLSLVTFVSLLGFPGALLAIPIAAVIQLLLDRFLLSNDKLDQQVPAGRDHNSVLRLEAQDLVQDVRKQLRLKEQPTNESTDHIEESIEAIANDLDLLLEQYDRGDR